MANQTFTVTKNLANVLANNVGMVVTGPQLVGISRGDITLVGGCIRRLYYQSGSDDLTFVAFDNGDTLTQGNAANLKDFREGFECAAKHGLGATICLDREKKQLSMLNLYPCLCECGEGEGRGHGQAATSFNQLSRS